MSKSGIPSCSTATGMVVSASSERAWTRTIHLDRLSRIDESGAAVPMRQNKELAAVDDYAWTGSETLRWRSRLPSDPPFEHREITYVLEYTASNILIPARRLGTCSITTSACLISNGRSTRCRSICRSIRSGRTGSRIPAHLTRVNAPRGENVTVTARLRHAGATLPAGVNFGAPAWLRDRPARHSALEGRGSSAVSSGSAKRRSAGSRRLPIRRRSIGHGWTSTSWHFLPRWSARRGTTGRAPPKWRR